MEESSMALIKIRGDLLESKADFICHQVNCMGVMGSGVALQVKNKWPDVYLDYLVKTNWQQVHGKPENLLGTTTFTKVGDNQRVVNMFAQPGYGYDGRRYTNYEAFARCLENIHAESKPGDTIAFPRLIGCDRGGADWTIIRTMIETILKDREIEVYCLKGGPEECQ